MFEFNPLLNSEYLQEIYGDDLSIVQIMFESFLEDSLSTWEEILVEIHSKNFDRVCEMAHQIKPSFSMVGLTFLHPKVQEFELYAKANPNYDELLSKYNSLSVDIEKAKLVVEEDLQRVNELI
jgi:HPt (histidine-containing phosphotransfer) domain-containing protein